MFGALLELGEARQGRSCVVEVGVGDLQQHAAVTLDDGGTGHDCRW